MAKQNKFDIDAKNCLALAIQVYKTQGFIRSGDGFTKVIEDGEPEVTQDNKTCVVDLIKQGVTPNEEDLAQATLIIDKFNGRYMLKKLTDSLNNFEKGVSEAFANTEMTTFNIAVIASIPHMNEVDKKRQEVSDKLEDLRFTSEFFGTKSKRYDINVEVIDVKYIQSSGVFMITTVHDQKDILKFWWRDQPDISDIIDGRTISIRGTVNKHEKSKYTNCHETMLNRVKILDNR